MSGHVQHKNALQDTLPKEGQSLEPDDIRILVLPPTNRYPDGFASSVNSALSFDKVAEHRTTSRSGIFKWLPFELLPEVGRHLDASDLTTLALVDHDFRQFARSYQFTTILLDYSERSRQLVEHIVKEAGVGSREGERGSVGSLGQCVRRVVVQTEFKHFAAHHAFPDGVLPVHAESLVSACTGYDTYLHLLASLLHCLPNIEVIQWKDLVPMDATVFNAFFASTSLRYLQLDGFHIRQSVPLQDICGASLSVLHLHLFRPWGSSSEQTWAATIKAVFALLELIAPTCEELLLFRTNDIPWRQFSLPRFPLLRRFASACDVDPFSPDDHCPLQHILSDQVQHSSPLKHLEVDVLSRKFIIAGRHLPSLTTLVCTSPTADDIQIVQVNPQLKSLIFMDIMDSAPLEEQLLPSISVAPFRLTTLKLGWLGKTIDEKALRTIATIVSLKQLWLAAASRRDFKFGHDWLIDHVQIRRALGGLTSLEDLAFSRDSYLTNALFELSGRYYENKYFPRSIDEKALLDEEYRALKGEEEQRVHGSNVEFKVTLRDAAWERWHRNRMVEEVMKYLETFPRLSFIFIGQWPLEISRRGVHGVTTTPLTGARQRDLCCSYVRRKWGIIQ